MPATIALTLVTLTACGNIPTNLIAGAAGEATPTTATDGTESPDGESAAPVVIPPASGHIIFVSNRNGQNNLYMSTPDGSQVEHLTSNISEDTMPRVSPDGTKVAYVSNINDNIDIYVIDLISRVITQVTNAPEKDSSPTWSPNSAQLAFESFRDGNFEIYVTNIDGSNQTRLTNDPAGDSNPIWSPTSNEIAFVSNRFGNADILLTNPSGTIFTLTTDPAPDSAPAWSPDGNFVSFQNFTGDLSDLCLVGRDGLNARCITTISAEYGPSVWSPDGTWLATSAASAIHLFNIRDGSTKQVFNQSILPTITIPAFSPDGFRLVFQAQFNGDMEVFYAVIETNEFTQLTSLGGYDGEAVWTHQ